MIFIIINEGKFYTEYDFKSREQAWTQAVEKANEIRNEQLK